MMSFLMRRLLKDKPIVQMHGDRQAEGRARSQPVSDIEESKTFEFIWFGNARETKDST
jgi:hypothetical protein